VWRSDPQQPEGGQRSRRRARQEGALIPQGIGKVPRRYPRKVRAAEIPLPPPARLEPDGASRPVFFARTNGIGARPRSPAVPGRTWSTQPCDGPLPRLGGVRRGRTAACVAAVRPSFGVFETWAAARIRA